MRPCAISARKFRGPAFAYPTVIFETIKEIKEIMDEQITFAE